MAVRLGWGVRRRHIQFVMTQAGTLEPEQVDAQDACVVITPLLDLERV